MIPMDLAILITSTTSCMILTVASIQGIINKIVLDDKRDRKIKKLETELMLWKKACDNLNKKVKKNEG